MNPKKICSTVFSYSKRAWSVAGLLAAFSLPSSAANLAVPGAFPTIAAAVAAAQPGDTISVGPGVYQEHVVSTVANLKFIGRGAIWDGTLTNGTAGVCLTATGDGVSVQGFTFRAGAGGVAQVQLTGNGCRVSKVSSRGPNGRFLRIAGTNAVVDTCRLFAVNSTAIEIIGDGAVVRRVRTRQCDDNVVRVQGHFATVTECLMTLNEDSFGISVSGTNAIVARNRFSSCDRGISVSGDGALVEKNNLHNTGLISVTGDKITVRGNAINGAPNDAEGLVVNSSSSAGGGVVENNKLKDIAATGLRVNGNNLLVRSIRITGAGTEGGESAVRISGTSNLVSLLRVVNGGTHGIDISGQGHILEKCFVVDAAADGFHVAGADILLSACRATLCSGEGLDNGGSNTTVIGSRFQNNRLDVANDGSFLNFAADNIFSTGGPAQPPQVD